MKVNEAFEAAKQYCKGQGWDSDATLLVAQVALTFQIKALIEVLQEGNKQSLAKADIRENHLADIKKLLSSRPIEQTKPVEQPKPPKGWLRRLID